MSKLTEEEQNMILYFWKSKEDLESWCGWEEIQPKLKEVAPELIKAWEDYKMSIRMLNAVVNNITNIS